MSSKPKIEVKNIEDSLTLDELAQINPEKLLKALVDRGVSVENMLRYLISLEKEETNLTAGNRDMECDEILVELEVIRKRRDVIQGMIQYCHNDRSEEEPCYPYREPDLQEHEFEIPNTPDVIPPNPPGKDKMPWRRTNIEEPMGNN